LLKSVKLYFKIDLSVNFIVNNFFLAQNKYEKIFQLGCSFSGAVTLELISVYLTAMDIFLIIVTQALQLQQLLM
jgi:hypothetical protein